MFRQPGIVAGTWKTGKEQDGDITEADARATLRQFDPLWDQLFPAEQACIVALMIERIDVASKDSISGCGSMGSMASRAR